MSYRVITLDLSAVIDDSAPVEIVGPGTTISEIVLLEMPVNTTIKFALGDNQLFKVSNPLTLQPRGYDEQERGLKWANPAAQPGVTIEIIVASGGVTGARIQ